MRAWGSLPQLGLYPDQVLLRNAEVARLVTGAGKEYGFQVENVTLDYAAAVERSRRFRPDWSRVGLANEGQCGHGF